MSDISEDLLGDWELDELGDSVSTPQPGPLAAELEKAMTNTANAGLRWKVIHIELLERILAHLKETGG